MLEDGARLHVTPRLYVPHWRGAKRRLITRSTVYPLKEGQVMLNLNIWPGSELSSLALLGAPNRGCMPACCDRTCQKPPCSFQMACLMWHSRRAMPRQEKLGKSSIWVFASCACLAPFSTIAGDGVTRHLHRFGFFIRPFGFRIASAAGKQRLQRGHDHEQHDRPDEHSPHHDDGERALHLAADGG